MCDGYLRTIRTVKHRIDLEPPEVEVIHSSHYRAGPAASQLEKADIYKMLRMRVIEPAQTEWASPIVFVPKKDGTLRLCVGYRRPNVLTVRDSYTIPWIDECID